jgi:hypothetical protein
MLVDGEVIPYDMYEAEDNDPRKNVMKPLKLPTSRDMHKLVLFLTFNNNKIDVVKYCPVCLMPSFNKVTYYDYYRCVTCNENLYPNEMRKMPLVDYLKLVRQIPLRNNGNPHPLYVNYNVKEVELIRSRCYNELSGEELVKLSELVK